MTTSWKRSREARLWHRLDPVQATRIMVDCHGDGAGAEVLLRAFLAERDMNPSAVRFWLEVYGALTTRQTASSTPAQAGAGE
ncbi:hypothetical protein [Microvirga sp. TS319]|uniref:hypothetical protein n=1 Tax=Microvirga sp. TS319 TaxID=3241165 RepID=UPI00351A2AF0